jgi:ubiquinone/menaquinone biosynthesis C-methylase UbiE
LKHHRLIPVGNRFSKDISIMNRGDYQTFDLAQTRYNPAMRRIWPWPSVLLEEVATWLKILPGAVWLDAACGDGQLADLLVNCKTVIGLDLDGGRVHRARPRPYAALIQGNLTSLPFASKSLSGIVCVETMEHIMDMNATLNEIARCLQPNGHLLLTMPSVTLRSLRQMKRSKEPVYCCYAEHIRELSSIPIRRFPNRFKTWKWLESTLVDFGFKRIRQGGVGFLFPMWEGRLGFVEHVMNIFYREKVNHILGKLPVIRWFPYYRIYLFRRKSI